MGIKDGERPPELLIERDRSPGRNPERPREAIEIRGEKPPVEAENVEPQIEAVKARLQPSGSHDESSSIPPELYGDFWVDKNEDGTIVLSPENQNHVEGLAAQFRREAKFMTNTVTGEPIAAEYDIHTRNFSTQTRIAALPDGRKVFLVYDHEGSSVHRLLDTSMKVASGLRMRKVNRAQWKEQFEGKSNIPVIENSDPDTIILPFLPNVNGYDLFAQNNKIRNFGVCDWATEADLVDKMELVDALVDEVARIHENGVAWGELILPNVIFLKDKRPAICDPEVRFDEDVSLEEAKAQDLKDLCISISGALTTAHGQTDPGLVVEAILQRYPDKEVIQALQKLAGKKRTFIQNLAFGYEQVRTGTPNKAHYDAVLKAIREFTY